MSIFHEDRFDFVGNGVYSLCTKNSVTAIDFKVSTALTRVNGAELLTVGSVAGDWIECKVVDKDNILGYGANLVLNQFVYKWFVHPSGVQHLEVGYAASIPQNTYIRVEYHSVGTDNDVQAFLNYFLHKER